LCTFVDNFIESVEWLLTMGLEIFSPDDLRLWYGLLRLAAEPSETAFLKRTALFSSSFPGSSTISTSFAKELFRALSKGRSDDLGGKGGGRWDEALTGTESTSTDWQRLIESWEFKKV